MVRQTDGQPSERRFPTRLIVAVIAVALLVWFAFANSQRVKVDFIVVDRRVRLVYALFISAVLGLIIGWFLARARRRD